MEKLLNKEIVAISAVLKDGDLAALSNATPDMFPTHGDVVSFILDYYQKNKAMPPQGIVENKFAVSIIKDVGTTRHHIEELKTLYLTRRLREILRDAGSKLQSGELASALNSVVVGTSSLKRDSVEIRDVDAVDIDEAVEHLKHIREMNSAGVWGVQFNMPGIDDFLPNGMIPGMFGLIIGYPSRGKSFLTTLLAVNAWDLGKRILYVSLEMTEFEVRNRFYAIAGAGAWSLRKLSRADVAIEDFREWASVRFKNKPAFPIIDNDCGGARFSPSALRAKIEEYKPDIVFIDYLQLMSPDSGTENGETVKLKNLSTELKLLAKSSKTAIIGVASATPADATDISSIPEMGQVAWSRQLAYDCDMMLAVGRADDSPILGVAWRKNRNGPLTDFVIDCNFDSGVFVYKELDFDA